MKVTAAEVNLNLLLSPGERSTGLHVSDIYGSLYAEIDPDRYGGDGGPNPVKMAMGLAWEAYVEKLLVAAGYHAERPGEFIEQEYGIAFSPDLLIYNGHTRMAEIKLTYMSWSADLSEPKFDKWKCQAMAYGHFLSIPTVTFYVLFVNGDYRKDRNPRFCSYEFTWSERELQENWSMLVNHAKARRLLR